MTRSNRLAATAAVALATLATFGSTMTVGSSDAEARGRHGGRHIHISIGRPFHGHRLHRHVFVTPVVVGGCYWLRERAEATGSRYWWNRYAACRGW